MNDVPRPTAGFVGLGNIGAPMSARLLKAGYPLVVHDVRPEAAAPLLAAGARWAASPRELAASCDVVFTCLPSLKAIETVALGRDGLIAGIRAGRAVFEMSTNSIDLARRLHAVFAERGAPMLEAPISGGVPGARRGRLAIWVGGDRATYDRFEPVLKAMADKTRYIGAFGAGLVTKLAHNCAAGAINAALAEVFSLAVKSGAEPLALFEALRQGTIGRRRTFDGLADQFLPAQYEPTHAPLRILRKDMLLATELGRELCVPMRLANQALADLVLADNRGWAERDCRVAMQLQLERSGVGIKVDPAALDAVFERDPPAASDAKHGA
jgi:3-hydroxyisobutyrate dehydrogenase